MPPRIDLTGQRFERLVVIAPAPARGRETFWLCRCDCGAELAVRTQCLAAWAEETGIAQTTIAWRLSVGWSVERALAQAEA